MKLATWTRAGSDGGSEGDVERVGVIVGEIAYPFEAGTTMLDLARAGLADTLARGEALIAAGQSVSMSLITLRPPLAPPSIRDFVAFEEHVEGVVRSVSGDASVGPEWYDAPTFYFSNPHTLRATGDPIAAPSGSQALDFELEVAVIIGSVPGIGETNLSVDDAHRAIFGYSIFNDWSARDVQSREMKVNLGPCKGKDFASTLGPWIVTADEFESSYDADGFLPIRMSVDVNGTEFGSDLLSNMGWPFAELVVYASRNSRVIPGDLLGSGTAGSGCLAEIWGRNGERTPPALVPGDTVRMTVEGIGSIENTIVPGQQLGPVAAARERPRRHSRVPSTEPVT